MKKIILLIFYIASYSLNIFSQSIDSTGLKPGALELLPPDVISHIASFLSGDSVEFNRIMRWYSITPEVAEHLSQQFVLLNKVYPTNKQEVEKIIKKHFKIFFKKSPNGWPNNSQDTIKFAFTKLLDNKQYESAIQQLDVKKLKKFINLDKVAQLKSLTVQELENLPLDEIIIIYQAGLFTKYALDSLMYLIDHLEVETKSLYSLSSSIMSRSVKVLFFIALAKISLNFGLKSLDVPVQYSFILDIFISIVVSTMIEVISLNSSLSNANRLYEQRCLELAENLDLEFEGSRCLMSLNSDLINKASPVLVRKFKAEFRKAIFEDNVESIKHLFAKIKPINSILVSALSRFTKFKGNELKTLLNIFDRSFISAFIKENEDQNYFDQLENFDIAHEHNKAHQSLEALVACLSKNNLGFNHDNPVDNLQWSLFVKLFMRMNFFGGFDDQGTNFLDIARRNQSNNVELYLNKTYPWLNQA